LLLPARKFKLQHEDHGMDARHSSRQVSHGVLAGLSSVFFGMVLLGRLATVGGFLAGRSRWAGTRGAADDPGLHRVSWA